MKLSLPKNKPFRYFLLAIWGLILGNMLLRRHYYHPMAAYSSSDPTEFWGGIALDVLLSTIMIVAIVYDIVLFAIMLWKGEDITTGWTASYRIYEFCRYELITAVIFGALGVLAWRYSIAPITEFWGVWLGHICFVQHGIND